MTALSLGIFKLLEAVAPLHQTEFTKATSALLKFSSKKLYLILISFYRTFVNTVTLANGFEWNGRVFFFLIATVTS